MPEISRNRQNARYAEDVVSVKDFGAVGDGVTDDTAAIQAAIDAVTGGGKVIFPSGIYRTSSTISLRSGVDIEVFSSGYRNGAYTYLQPTSDVTKAVYANELDGGKVYGLSVDMQNMPDGSVGIDNRSTWNMSWEKCVVFNVSQTNSVGWKNYSEASASQGNYWQHYRDCTVLGTAGTGWYFLGQSSGATRLTSQMIVNCQSQGMDYGWDFNYVGSMMTADNINAESAAIDGIRYQNASGGTYLQLNGGEITGNTGFGLNAATTVICNEVVFSNNGTDYTDQAVIKRANTLFTGASESRWIADRFQSQSSIVTLLAAESISSQYQFVRVSGNGGPVTLTSSPQIDDPKDSLSQVLVVMGGSNTNTVELVDGNGLRLKGNITLGLEDTIVLAYHSSFGDWVEISRSINAPNDYTTSNVTPDRSFNADSTTLDEVADVLGTLIEDLISLGVLR